jgi:hypothetical protein
MIEDDGLDEWEICIVSSVHGQWEFHILKAHCSEHTERNKMDSHADTVIGGCNFILLHETGEYVTVHSFSDERKPFEKFPIGTIATAWVDPATSETKILVFHKALFFGD